MQLQFSAPVFAADTARRQISGMIVPFGTPGNTSAGPVVFIEGAFGVIQSDKIFLNLEHKMTERIGKMVTASPSPAGIMATFSIAPTTAGNDALVEASEGLRDGLSIEAEAQEFEIKEGVMYVTAATLTGVGLVTKPAFPTATVTDVAASEGDDLPEVELEDGVADIETSETADAEADTENPDNPEGVTMESNETAPAVEGTPAVPVQASAPAFTAPRSPINSMASYIEHAVLAKRGSEESRQYVMAADADKRKLDSSILAADSTGNPGIVHPSYLNEIISTSLGTTAAIDAVGTSRLVESGLSFYIPKATQYPTVATTAEGAAASDTDLETDLIEVAIVKKAGKQKLTFELFDRSTPAAWQEVQRQLMIALGKNKDEYLISQLVAGGTAGSTTAGTIAGLQDFIATESTAALAGSGDFANVLLASPDWWTAIKKARDTTGRSLYNAVAPQNAGGNVAVNSLRGEVEGLGLYVDPFLAAGSGLVDGSALVMTAEAARYWESPVRQIQVNNLADGSIEVEYYQYVAAHVVKSSGVRKFNLT